MVRRLQEAGRGDAGRLAHVSDAIARGRAIYRSDRRYVEIKFAEMGRGDPAGGGPHGARRGSDARSGTGHTEHGGASRSGGAAGTGQGLRPHTPPQPPCAAPPPRQRGETEAGQGLRHAAPPGGEGSSGRQRASAAWYLLPIFMSIVGGIISYAALRHRDPSRARRTLAVGAVLFVMLAAAVAAVVVHDPGTGTYGGMADGEIKAAASEVPYAALARNPGGYAGMLIRYEGHVVQAEKDPFSDAYVLRIGTSSNEIGLPEEDIWSEYRPRSGAEERWLDGLDREGLIAPGESSGVAAWGEVVGSQEYDTLFGGKRAIPAVNVLILERAGG